MKPTQYQQKPRFERVVLWLRHMPMAWLVGVARAAWWLCTGARKVEWMERMSIWEIVRGAVRCHLSIAEYRMGNYYHLTDVIEDLRLRAGETLAHVTFTQEDIDELDRRRANGEGVRERPWRSVPEETA